MKYFWLKSFYPKSFRLKSLELIFFRFKFLFQSLQIIGTCFNCKSYDSFVLSRKYGHYLCTALKSMSVLSHYSHSPSSLLLNCNRHFIGSAVAVRVVIEDIVPCFMISYWSESTINRVSRVHSFVCHEISSRLTRNWSLQTSSSWWSSTTVLSFLLQDSSLKHFLLRPS